MIEVEFDAERAGCFAERQLRLGLGVDEAIPETRDRFGRPVERTTERFRTRIGAVHGDMGRGCTAPANFRCWSERNSSNNFLNYHPESSAVTRTFETAVAKVYQSTGCARRGQRAVGDPSTTGLCVYV